MLSNCLLEIEKKLNWGSSEYWNTQDFERLSEQIAAETAVVLSSTTLKRLWGKVKYNSTPNGSTLDALAQFLGAENWRSYQQNQRDTFKMANPSLEESPITTWSVRSRWKLALLTFSSLLLVSLFAFIFSSNADEELLRPADFKFQSRPVAKGIPNSVIFEYDASAAPEDAVVEIQQSWDTRKRTQVSASDQLSTSIYYRPGFFNAKLVVNDQIVAQHDVFIPTEDWLGFVEQTPVPIYFEPEEIVQEDQIAISVDLLEANGINPKQNNTYVRLYRVEDFGDVRVNDFTMETSLKNTFGEGVSACQNVEIILLCSGQAIIIPLSIPGCIAQNRLWVLDTLIDGKTQNLSTFGTDFSDWVKVKVKSENGQISFWVEEELAYQLPLEVEADRKIMGICYRFQGAGAVKDLELGKQKVSMVR